MSADRLTGTLQRGFAAGRSLAQAQADEWRFWLGLACALVLHAALIVGFGRSLPRQMGEPEGRPEAVNVDIVDEADFASRAAAPQPAVSRPVTEQPEASPSARTQEDKPAAAPAVENGALEPSPIAPSAGQRAEPDARAKSKPRPQRQVDLSLPTDLPDAMIAPGGRATSATRPPDITRSGENDDFGRGVIRALRQTMPPPRGMLGRVTVRLLLSENGNLVEVRLIRGSGHAQLDQSVMFAVKQASFPIPPSRSSTSDRIFLVTYIYG